MLIINADDWGLNPLATDRILSCFEKKRITSTSAMVFMEDSERAAEFALNTGLEVGIHLNFTDGFTDSKTPSILREFQQRIADFLLKNKYCSVLYNPFLRRTFEHVYWRQHDEFVRLYGKVPAHVNGHRHMHLCTNVILDRLIPKHSKVRKTFSFSPGEKSSLNRLYRHCVDFILKGRYVCPDFFFSIAPVHGSERLLRIVNLSRLHNVELMVHPQKPDEYEYLMSAEYQEIIGKATTGIYGAL
jgi:chitin disaccharide deacetylase